MFYSVVPCIIIFVSSLLLELNIRTALVLTVIFMYIVNLLFLYQKRCAFNLDIVYIIQKKKQLFLSSPFFILFVVVFFLLLFQVIIEM